MQKRMLSLWSRTTILFALACAAIMSYVRDFVQAFEVKRHEVGALGLNVLTSLAPDIYKAADMIGRELVGIIPSVIINGDATERAAKDQPIRSHFTRIPTVNTSFAPSMAIPEGTDQTVDNKTMTISQYASVQIPWTGEEVKYLNNGVGFQTIYGDQIIQAMRAITNTIEAYAWGVIRKGASRAWGTAGTTPFASNFNEVPQVRKILVDNGCPMDGAVTLALDTTAGANLRSLAQLQKANEAGGTELLRQGTLLDLSNLRLKESAAPAVVTKGTGAGYLVNNAAGYPVGTTTITVDTGTGTILAGDVVTFTGDTNKYVAAGLSGTTLTLNEPGLRKAVVDNVAITVGNDATANVAMHRNAAEIAMRAPALPSVGDAAVDNMVVMDPHSGLVFEVAAYRGYMKAMFEVRCLYDAKVWKPAFISQLLG